MALLGDAGLASVRRGDALLGNANQCKTKEFFDEGNQNFKEIFRGINEIKTFLIKGGK